MKKLLLLLFCGAAFAQGVRYDLPPVLNSLGKPIANPQITLCTGTASISGSNCTGTAQSFTDITLATPCAGGSPVTLTTSNVCRATGDALGNAGFWLTPGAYIYCVNAPSTTGSCYNLSVPVGTTAGGTATITGALTAGGNVTATAGQNTLNAYNINNTYYVDGNKYTTIDAAIAAVPSFTIASPTGCTETSTTATCNTTTAHGFQVGQAVWVQGNSVASYNGEWTLTAVASTSFQFSVCTVGGTPSCVSGLGTGSGGTASPSASIVIPWTYTGAESAACAAVDGYTESNTAPNISVFDYRGTAACGYSVAYNSSQQGSKPVQLSVWQKRSSPFSTSSAVIATNQTSGVMPASGTMAGLTSELDDCSGTNGCVASTESSIAHVAIEGYYANRATGTGIILEADGGTLSVNQDRTYSTISIGQGQSLFAHKCTNVSSTAVINECYGVQAEQPTAGLARNYSFFGGSTLTGNNQNWDVLDGGTNFTITTTSESGNTVTVNVSGGPCTYTTGQSVTISGNSVTGYNIGNGSTQGQAWILSPGCNGGSSFTYTSNVTGLAGGSGGTATVHSVQHFVTFQSNNLIVIRPLQNTQGFEFESQGGAGLFHIDSASIVSRENHQFTGSINFTNLLISPTAPTIAAGGCGGSAASMTVTNGTAAFEVNTGTAPGSACTITMPAATTGWNCDANHTSAISTTNFIIQQTGAVSTTSVVLTLFSDVAAATSYQANDTLRVKCSAN